ncbi:ankyrin repeat domain-containing protein [Parashewanella curva]|uniref:Ankyrin repeat domain-containing protein n=1 Tax=Parashewanella curva TaxID=2338552 RepID=A0A3L8PYE5_9GAMM|nr:ankyrin repeat domain-containing protein [Parashewanella curva]RLV60361.1 ankyrin repeat domain-containing protein [Parashewanella curva]
MSGIDGLHYDKQWGFDHKYEFCQGLKFESRKTVSIIYYDSGRQVGVFRYVVTPPKNQSLVWGIARFMAGTPYGPCCDPAAVNSRHDKLAEKLMGDLEKHLNTTSFIQNSIAAGNITEIEQIPKSVLADRIFNHSGEVLLHHAVRVNSTETVTVLKAKEVDVNVIDNCGMTPLMLCCIDDNADMAKLLLDKGAKISHWLHKNYCDENGRVVFPPKTGLFHLVAHYDAKKCMELFINEEQFKGYFLDEQNEEGITPLHIAAKRNRLMIMQMMFKSGNRSFSINRPSHVGDRHTALHMAVVNDHNEVLTLLCANGADINVADKMGNYPIHLALLRRNVASVKLLLEGGAALDVLNSEDLTPIELAGHLDLDTQSEQVCLLALFVDYLEQVENDNDACKHLYHKMDAGIYFDSVLNDQIAKVKKWEPYIPDLRYQNHYFYSSLVQLRDKTLLGFAVEHSTDVVFHRLVNSCPKYMINVVDFCGMSPLHLAVKTNQPEKVKALLERDANPHLIAYNGESPLFLALKYTVSPLVLKVLLEHDADPDFCITQEYLFQFDRCKYLIEYAAEYAQLEKLQILLEFGADANKFGSVKCCSALYWAISRNATPKQLQLDMIHLLLESGADPKFADIRGETPLHLAIELGNVDVLDLLLKERKHYFVQILDIVLPNAPLPMLQHAYQLAGKLKNKQVGTRIKTLLDNTFPKK